MQCIQCHLALKTLTKVLIIGPDELVLFLFKLRGLILQDTVVWEIQISNVFRRLAVRSELAQMHKCVDHITGQLVGAGPTLSSVLLPSI